MIGHKRALMCGIALTGVLPLSAAFAQSQPVESADATAADTSMADSSAPEIVVTAQRRSQSLKDVPMSINVATGQQLQRLNIFDVKDVQQLAPGLDLTNDAGRNNKATLRGISYEPDSGTLPAVDTYINDIPVDAQTAFTAIYDVEQIEVLRGPQGALRGRTAPAGAITIRTRKPDLDDVDGYLLATATNRDGYNAQGGVSLPIVPGKLAMRVAMLVDGNRLNNVTNVTRGQRSRSRTESGRISLAWQPVDNLRADISYQYLNADNRQFQQVFGPGNVPAAGFGGTDRSGPAAAPGDYIAVSDGLFRFQNNTHFVNLGVDWDLGGVAIEFNGAHQYSVLNQVLDIDPSNSVPNYILPQRTRIPYNVNTAELRIVSKNDGFWNWTIGGYFDKQTGDAYSLGSNDVFFAPAPIQLGLVQPVSTLALIPAQPGRTLAIAGSSRFQFTDKLSLEVAARYTDSKMGQFIAIRVAPQRTNSTNPADFPIGPITVIDQKTHVKPLTGGATLSYKVNPDVSTYLSYGRSYRRPTALSGGPQNLSPDLLLTKGEHSDSFEAGVKAWLFDRKLSIDVAAFYQKFDGYISRFNGIAYDNGTNVDGVVTGPPDGIVDGTTPINFNGKAVVKGIEATLSGRPTDNWDFSVSAAYAHARYDNARVPCNDFDGDGKPDSTPISTRKITGGGNVSFCTVNGRLGDNPDFNLSANTELRFGHGDLQPFVRALFTYRPGFTSTLSAFDYQDRENLNLFAGLRSEESRWEINLFAKNVLNQKRITNISQTVSQLSTASGTPYDSGYRLINTTNPREFGITTSYRF